MSEDSLMPREFPVERKRERERERESELSRAPGMPVELHPRLPWMMMIKS